MKTKILLSVGDPDLQDDVFGPPRSGSFSQWYGSGSGSFPFLINAFRYGPGSFSQMYGSEDPDPHQNVTDPLLFLLV
jgi:hypothetical protein